MTRRSPPLERPIKITVSYTHSCNLDCRVCYAGCTPQASVRELPAAAWKPILDDAIESGVMSVMFEGGEPLHRADFPDTLAHCATRAMTRLRTNATLIDDGMAARLRAANLGDALVDVLGATAETHDWLTGVPGSHARMVEGVAALQRAGIPVTLLTIMNRRNVHELQQVLDWGGRLGAEAVGVLRPYPLGRMRENWDALSLGLDEMMAAVGGLVVPAGTRLMQSWHPNDANCCWQMSAANAYGDSIGCTYLREYVDYGNLAERTLLETWEHPLYRTLREGRVREILRRVRDDAGVARRLPVHRVCLPWRVGRAGPVRCAAEQRDRPAGAAPVAPPGAAPGGAAAMMRHTEGLRLRPVPELGTCLAFTPHPPRLHTLNPSAWLIVELCRAGRMLEDEYVSRVSPPLSRADALAQLGAGVASLRDAGIIEDATAERTAA